MNHSILIVLICASAVFLSRFLPFLIFPEHKETPPFVTYLSKTLPIAIVGMLLIYCLKDVSIMKGSRGIPELLSIAIVALLQWYKRNEILSIVGGTIMYMVLIQVVF